MLGGEAVIVDPDGRTPDIYYNSVFALDHSARILWRYDKAHLVPFGEYLPLRPLLEKIGLSMLVPGDGDFSYGPGPRTFDAPGFGTLGLQVCYEIIFSGRVIDAAHRPSFLFNPVERRMVRLLGPAAALRASATARDRRGVPVVRATPTGNLGNHRRGWQCRIDTAAELRKACSTPSSRHREQPRCSRDGGCG